MVGQLPGLTPSPYWARSERSCWVGSSLAPRNSLSGLEGLGPGPALHRKTKCRTEGTGAQDERRREGLNAKPGPHLSPGRLSAPLSSGCPLPSGRDRGSGEGRGGGSGEKEGSFPITGHASISQSLSTLQPSQQVEAEIGEWVHLAVGGGGRISGTSSIRHPSLTLSQCGLHGPQGSEAASGPNWS